MPQAWGFSFLSYLVQSCILLMRNCKVSSIPLKRQHNLYGEIHLRTLPSNISLLVWTPSWGIFTSSCLLQSLWINYLSPLPLLCFTFPFPLFWGNPCLPTKPCINFLTIGCVHHFQFPYSMHSFCLFFFQLTLFIWFSLSLSLVLTFPFYNSHFFSPVVLRPPSFPCYHFPFLQLSLFSPVVLRPPSLPDQTVHQSPPNRMCPSPPTPHFPLRGLIISGRLQKCQGYRKHEEEYLSTFRQFSFVMAQLFPDDSFEQWTVSKCIHDLANIIHI